MRAALLAALLLAALVPPAQASHGPVCGPTPSHCGSPVYGPLPADNATQEAGPVKVTRTRWAYDTWPWSYSVGYTVVSTPAGTVVVWDTFSRHSGYGTMDAHLVVAGGGHVVGAGSLQCPTQFGWGVWAFADGTTTCTRVPLLPP